MKLNPVCAVTMAWCAVVIFTISIGVAEAQSLDCQPAAAALKTIAREQWQSSSDVMTVLRALDKAAAVDTVYMNQHLALTIHSDDTLLIDAWAPYFVYRYELSEALRKRLAIDTVIVPPTVRVDISPSQIGAPDISRVILERDGKDVQPVRNTLLPTPMRTALGVRAVIHKGALFFECSAFAPGAKVVLTAIPESGANITYRFSQRELGFMTGLKTE